MKTTKNVKVLLKFEVKVDKGELELQVVDAENNVLSEKYFAKSEAGEIEIALKINQNYQVKFIGKDTKGFYFCQWLEQ